MMRRVLVGAAIAGLGWAGYAAARRWYETWGVDEAEAVRSLPGDELVDAPTGILTRGITIDAPPSAIWPLLVQMGYGRAGWYSYDALDMRGSSATGVRDELQGLAVGDIVPTHPDGGFEARIVEPDRALVLFTDTALVTRQAGGPKSGEEMPPGLAASGRILASTPQEFAASWAFVLEPLNDGRTRLLERFRIWYGEQGRGFELAGPLFGFGVFVMMQRQMTGIRERAERLAGRAAQPGEAHGTEPVDAAPTNGAVVPVGEMHVVATG